MTFSFSLSPGPSTSSIPPRHYKSTAENVASGSANSLGNNREVKNPRDRRKKMRNQSRVERAKAYFIRKKAEFNSRSVAVDDANNAAEIVINISDDSRSN